MKMLLLLSVLLSASGFASVTPDDELAIKVNEIQEIRKFFAVESYARFSGNLGSVKVAVLDKGFKGILPAREDGRRFLPKSADVISAYPNAEVDIALDNEDPHGTHMAHLIWALTGYHEEGPLFRLYNANGPENFLLAVDHLLKWKPDVVVFSQNWETYGNFDGSGFIDQAVKEVTDEGIIWLNAAGNDGGNIYNGPVKLATTDGAASFVQFDTDASNKWYLRFKNRVDENRVTITLSWNSFSPGWEALGTDKDLDLLLFSQEKGKSPQRIAISQLRQTKEKTGEDAESIHARERITVTLPADVENDYLLAVYAPALEGNPARFDAKKDRLRLTIQSSKGSFVDEKTKKTLAALDFLDATDNGEIPVPADGVGLAVGDLTPNSAKGPTVDGRGKPEIVMEKNSVTFSDRQGFYGTSYANAYLGGIVALLKSAEPRMAQADLLDFRTRYPMKYLGEELKNQGWAISENPVIEPVLAKFIQDKWGIDYLVVQGPGGLSAVASSKSVDKIGAWPAEVKNNLDDYYLYLRAERTKTTKQVRVPEQREVIVRAGYDKTKFKRDLEKYVKTAGYYKQVPRTKTYNVGDAYLGIDLVRGTLGAYQNQLTLQYMENKWVEPEYDYRWVNVPNGTEWIEPETRKQTVYVYKNVAGETKVEAVPSYQKRKNARAPWEIWGGRPSDYLQVLQLSDFSFLGKGAVVDGTANDPRIWETPSFEKLQRVVRARENR